MFQEQDPTQLSPEEIEAQNARSRKWESCLWNGFEVGTFVFAFFVAFECLIYFLGLPR